MLQAIQSEMRANRGQIMVNLENQVSKFGLILCIRRDEFLKIFK